MTFLPVAPFPKVAGDAIVSQDWNDIVQEIQRLDTTKVNAQDWNNIVQEIQRLDTAKVNRAGDALSGDLTIAGALGIGTSTPQETLDVNGRIKAGSATIGTWPAGSRYVFFGANSLDQSNERNYALLQQTATGSALGQTFLNSPVDIRVRINNIDKLMISNDGHVHIIAPSQLNFGASTRQMINLWRVEYGIGVQNYTQYFRSIRYFAWYRGGSHSDSTLSPGSGGSRLMTLRETGDLEITGQARKPGGGSWASTSDSRLKHNVQPLRGALDKLLQLRGVSFEWRDPAQHGTGRQRGMLAQEVETVFPDWVSTDPQGYKELTYRGFEALTVEALRELHTAYEGLQDKYRALTTTFHTLQTRLCASCQQAVGQPQEVS